MAKPRRVIGIGEVDERGEIINGYQYGGQKGFKMTQLGNSIVVYSLEKQKKLFSIPKDLPIRANEKAVVIPLAPIRFLVMGDKYGDLFRDEKLLGVFNANGNLIGFSRKVKLEKEYFMLASIDGKWGAYTYEGEEILTKSHFYIKPIELNVLGEKRTVFYVVSSEKGTKTLFSEDKRLLIPWKSQEITIDIRKSKVVIFDKDGRKDYNLDLDTMGRIKLIRVV